MPSLRERLSRFFFQRRHKHNWIDLPIIDVMQRGGVFTWYQTRMCDPCGEISMKWRKATDAEILALLEREARKKDSL